jgi:hypothetical protein
MAARAPGSFHALRRPRVRRHDPDWEPPIPGRRRVLRTWDEYMALAKRIIARFDHQFDLRHFDYRHPVRLQRCALRFRRPYPVKVAYTDGASLNPIVVCWAVANRRCLQLPRPTRSLPRHLHGLGGRGRSGWMATSGTIRSPPTSSS